MPRLLISTCKLEQFIVQSTGTHAGSYQLITFLCQSSCHWRIAKEVKVADNVAIIVLNRVCILKEKLCPTAYLNYFLLTVGRIKRCWFLGIQINAQQGYSPSTLLARSFVLPLFSLLFLYNVSAGLPCIPSLLNWHILGNSSLRLQFINS